MREIVKETLLEDVTKEAFYAIVALQYRARDIITRRYKGPPLAVDDYYRIEPAESRLTSFLYPINVGKRHRRNRILGRYETHVQQRLAEHVDGDTTFWEVGSYRGYFSLATADKAAGVLAVDARDYALKKLQEAAGRNGYQNITTQHAVLGETHTLTDLCEEYGTPDVVLMDIEGWEYDVLQNSRGILDFKPVLIIEIHEESGWLTGEVTTPTGGVEHVPTPDNPSPTNVEDLLQKNGYRVEKIDERRTTNYHIEAVPEPE